MRMTMLAGLAAAAVAVAGCRGDAGPTVERSFPDGSFERIAVGGAQQVIVAVGGASSVRAEGPQELVERLQVRTENRTLTIGSGERGWSLGFGTQRTPVTVHVTVPRLRAATVGGSGTIRIDRIESDRFEATTGGSGEIDIGRMRVRSAAFTIGGSGRIRAAGAAERSEIELAGSGTIDVSRLDTRDVVVTLWGSGDVIARATGTAQVSIAGSGDVTVSGPARCSVADNGAGDVRCGD